MSVIRTSDILTRWSTERPSNYCFLINAHIPWRQLHEKTAVHVCIFLRSIVDGLALSSFPVLSSSLLPLWPCLCCGSENVICSSPKMKVLCAEYLSFRLMEHSGQGSVPTCSDNWHSTVLHLVYNPAMQPVLMMQSLPLVWQSGPPSGICQTPPCCYSYQIELWDVWMAPDLSWTTQINQLKLIVAAFQSHWAKLS